MGIKQYWPTQIGIKWNFTNTGSTIDSSKMGIQAQLPWYSLEYQDLIKSKDSLSLAGVQTAISGMQHMLGTKQYELTNHLGNVMATLSDKRKGIKVGGGNDSIISYRHALPAVYDYYPFGMLMPGRYMSDTSSQCVWITQTTFAPMWVDIVYDLYFNGTKNWIGKGVAGLMIAGQGTENPVLEVTTSATGAGMENTSYDGVPGQTHEVTAEISYLQGSWDMVVEEYKDDNWQQLASVAIDAATSYTLSFVPSVSSVRYTFMNKTGSGIPTSLHLKTYHLKSLEYRQQNTVTQVCNSSADKYRFGFNGQEKDNEIAGIGNHNTAFFGELDVRLGRRWNKDPKPQVGVSSYTVFNNSPVWFSDLLLDTPSVKEAAYIADHVYGADKKGKYPELKGGWKQVDLNIPGVVYHDTKSGYDAGLYSRVVGGKTEYVFATRGTEGDWGDISADLKQPLGLSKQYNINAANAKALQTHFGENTDLTFVGHSLGGGLAAANAMVTNHPAITFNAAGVGLLTKARTSTSFGNFARNLVTPVFRKIDACVVRGEILNMIQKPVGLGADGTIHKIAPSIFSGYRYDPSGISDHTMGAVKNAIDNEGIK